MENAMNRRIVASVCVASLLGVTIVKAQLAVFDASVYGEAVAEVSQLIQQYNQLVQTHQMITNQYKQMLWMAQTLPGSLTRFRAVATPWFASAATNTYGTTGAWTEAVDTGVNAPAGYSQAVGPLMAYAGALANVPADELQRLQKYYGTVELADGANVAGIQTLGTIRANAAEVESAIQQLEDASLSSDPSFNTEIAVLNKINAAGIIALRNAQDTNKLLTTLVEEKLVESKGQRDWQAQAFGNHIAFMGNEQAYLASQTAGTSGAMMTFRMP
jgi:hypothetical protein